MPRRLLALVGPLIIAALAVLYFNRADLRLPANVLTGSTAVKTATSVSSSSSASATSTTRVQTTTTTVKTNADVVRVVDGDTIVARLDAEPGTEYKIRLLGVNTPETVDPRRAVQCFGKQASDFAKKTLSGKRVRLEADPQADERDKYDRLLRNITLADGTDFNALLVREGFANAYLSFPLNAARKVELRKLEAEAKAAGRGLWAPGVCNN